MMLMGLLDISGPETGGISFAVFFVLALIIVAVSAVILGGALFLVWRKRRKSQALTS